MIFICGLIICPLNYYVIIPNFHCKLLLTPIFLAIFYFINAFMCDILKIVRHEPYVYTLIQEANMDDEKLLMEGEKKEEGENPLTAPTDPTVTSTEEEVATDTIGDNGVAGIEVSVGENPIQETPIIEENGATETSYKTFTQDDVDKLVGETRVKTREKTFNYIYNRYGVKNEEELDSLVANAQRYDTLKEDSDMARKEWETERNERDGKLTELSEEIALMKSGVDADRYEDVKLILRGKGMDVTAENIEAELATHPEWISKGTNEESVETPSPVAPVENTVDGEQPQPVTTTTRIKTLGNEPKPAPAMSEEEEAEKLFKMKFH